MTALSYAYFDEKYFQSGSEKGTAYTNYKQSAHNSPTFREIAVSLGEVFQPRRVLEIGCATGIIVRHLNDLGCEAHGIDVSEWAVENAEHPNVKLASADQLPFPDSYFDLVMSCHSLEHLPASVFEPSIKEICRVASEFLFHMLPMVGTPPYIGDPETVRQNLRKDPTHQQLHTREDWVGRFAQFGCLPVPACILFENETSNVELSTGQFTLKKNRAIGDSEVQSRAASRNQRVFRTLQQINRNQSRFHIPPHAVSHLVYADRAWKDVERRLGADQVIDLARRRLHLVLMVEGAPCALRFAAGRDTATDQYADVGEFHLSANPGCNVFTFGPNDLQTLRGSPDYSAINHLAVGGENANTAVTIFLCDDSGASLLQHESFGCGR